MQTKLTLRLDEDLIERAKRYAAAEGKSVSQVVAGFFELIGRRAEPATSSDTPVTDSLCGVLPQTVDEDRAAYRAHLMDKQR